MDKTDSGKQDQTVVKSVSLADVKRRLQAEKKRIANLRKSRLETKTTPPKSSKTAPAMKRKAERRSVETEVPKKKADLQVEVTKKKADSQAEAPKKKVDLQAEVPKKKVDSQAEVPKKKVDSQVEVPKKKVDSQAELPKKKVDSQVEVPKKKVDPQAEVPKKKVDSPTKNPGKSVAASTVSMPETSTRKRTTRPPSPKTTPIPDQEQESKLGTPEHNTTTEDKDTKSDAGEDSEEDKMPLATLATNQKESKPEGEHQSGKLPPDTEYTVGYRLEAKDFNNDWYPARVVEVDYDDREVLVHFDRWSSRYDEWINMDSPRLRASGSGPLSNPSSSKPSKSASKQKSSTPVKPVTPATPEKQAPQVVTTVAPPVVAATPTPIVAPAPPTVTHRTFKVGDQVMASWSDSRKYPAKIVEVLENDMYNVLFFDGFMKSIKGNRITPGLRPGTQMETVTTPEVLPTVPASPYPPEEDIGSKADRRERKRKINVCELFSMKRRASPPAKSPASSSVQSPTTKSIPVPAKSTSKPVASADTPPPAKKSKKHNQKLQSPGQEDLLLIKSLTSTPAADANKTKSRNSPATSSTELRRVRTLLPRTRSDDSSPVLEPPPPHNPFTRSAAAATVTQETTPQAPLASILEGIEVEMEEGNFKCPSEGCGKLHRKENLLQMHIKHYHPELKSRLMVVPKVLDLAYARTVGDLPSTAVMPRNIGSGHSSTSPASGPVVNQRKSLTLQAPPKKIIKPEKLATEETAVEKSPPPIIDPPQTSRPASPASSPAKPGQIKTLLPINRSPEDKVAKPAVEAPPPQPLSALQQALMSPPGHLSALLQSPSKLTYDNRPKTVVKLEAKPVYHPSTRNHISPGSPRGKNMRDERSPNKELVNCMCGVPEEDGLMIQCDLCMCWQHGLCNMIETEEQVPEKYVCYICLHPARERQSRKYAHDQDWLKEGTLPRMPIRRNQGRIVRTNTELLLKETHDVTAAIIRLQQVIHSLRVKINIAEKSDHPKLYLWSKRWESDEENSPLSGKQEEEDIKPDVKQEFTNQTLGLGTEGAKPSGSVNEEVKLELDTQAKSETTNGDMKTGSSNEDGKLGSADENMKPASSTDDELKSGSQEDADLHLALNLPLSQSELEHLANTVEHKLRSTEESQVVVPMVSTPVPQAKAPEPEAPIQLASCRLVLLEHIERLQAKLEARLAELELRADQLEARDPELAGVCERDQNSSTKDTLCMLQRDLDSVNKISEYATSD